MSPTRVPKYPDQLPATPCTPAMRAEIERVARARGDSLAEVQRDAISLFLSVNSSNAIDEDSKAREA